MVPKIFKGALKNDKLPSMRSHSTNEIGSLLVLKKENEQFKTLEELIEMNKTKELNKMANHPYMFQRS
jgi:hypothetical protein